MLENILQKQYSINNGLFKRTPGIVGQVTTTTTPTKVSTGFKPSCILLYTKSGTDLPTEQIYDSRIYADQFRWRNGTSMTWISFTIASAYQSGMITAIDDDGFTLDKTSRGITYYYFACE